MYTSQKREHVNAFASRLLGVDSETLLRDQECIASVSQAGLVESLFEQQGGVGVRMGICGSEMWQPSTI